MGTTVIGGMLAASALAIFLIPVTFYVIEMWATKGQPHGAPRASSPPRGRAGSCCPRDKGSTDDALPI